jgi:acryloyl-coenzyme A reductase
MHAIVLRQFGGAENLRIEERPIPSPGPGEVLLRVRACGVCYHDVINRRGGLPRTPLPSILGHEAAGEVIEVGAGVKGWSIGDRGATLQRLSCGDCLYCRQGKNSLCRRDPRFFGEEIPGGYAQYMVAPVRGLCRVPASLSWSAAATVCCTTGTAVHVLRTRGKLQRGESLLITGASGGVGMQAIQLARLDGARVLAVTSSEEKVEALYEAGAHEVIVSRGLDFSAEVRKRTDGEGVNVAMEIVGSSTFPQTLKAMAPAGRVLVVGNLETATTPLNPGLVIVKELEIIGAYATNADEMSESLGLLESGALKPCPAEELPLSHAARAHERLERRGVAGRLVLLPPNE